MAGQSGAVVTALRTHAAPAYGTHRHRWPRLAGTATITGLVLTSCALQPVTPPALPSRFGPAPGDQAAPDPAPTPDPAPDPAPAPVPAPAPDPPPAPDSTPAPAPAFPTLSGPPPSGPETPVSEIGPGESWADALRAVAPGQAVRLRPGTYAPQILRDLALPGVTLWGAARDSVVVPQIELAAVSGLTIGNLTVTAAARDSSVRIRAGSHDLRLVDATVRPRTGSGVDIFEGASAVTVERVAIDGSAQNTKLGRGVRILNEGPPETWSHDIVIRASDIGHVAADAIMLAGARAVTIEGNDIHDLQANDDHNDGIASAGSIGLRIVGNRFRSPGRSGPDQAIILGRPDGSSTLVVRDTYIAGNIVGSWRGTGIILSGTENTTIVGNSVAAGGTPDFRSASLDLRGSAAAGNTGLRVYDNVLYAVRVTNTRTDLWQDHNCVETGARGPNDVAAAPGFTDPDTLARALEGPCAGLGAG
jgi:hypothetical protein